MPRACSVTEIRITTERLILRRERAGDRDSWLEHMNTAQVTEHLGGPLPLDKVHASFDRMAEAGDLPFLLIERTSDGVLIGKCGLSRIDTPCAPAALQDEVQIGWTIRADCWGQGYARESAQAMMAYAFDRAKRENLYAQTSGRNQRSQQLMNRLGMIRLLELDYDDPDYPAEENPTIVFAISRNAWRGADG